MMRVEEDRVVVEVPNILTIGDLRRAIEAMDDSTPVSCAAGEPLLVSVVTPLCLETPIHVEVS